MDHGNARTIQELLLKAPLSTHLNSPFGACTFQYASESAQISKQSLYVYAFDHVICYTNRMITPLVCLDIFDHLKDPTALSCVHGTRTVENMYAIS